MKKNIICKCGKVLGTRCLETQEIILSTKVTVVSSTNKDVKILCSNCNNTCTEIGKIKRKNKAFI